MALRVGDVEVPITPNLDRFARTLSRSLSSAIREVSPVRIDVDVDRRKLRRTADQIADAVADPEPVQLKLDVDDRSLRRARGKIRDLSDEADRARGFDRLRARIRGVGESLTSTMTTRFPAFTAGLSSLAATSTNIATRAGRSIRSGLSVAAEGFTAIAAQARNTADRVLPALSAALGATAKAAGLFGLAIGASIGFGVKIASDLEQTNIALTTMLGSSEAAAAMIDQLTDFAAKTPFELPGLLDGTRRLLAMGSTAEQIIPQLTAIGDAASALGLGQEGINRIVLALGQMQAKGKVSGEEMRQLAEAGIPAWQMLSEVLGVSVNQAMKDVENRLVDANVFIDAFTNQVGPMQKMRGAMQQQSQTLRGLFSTLKDTVQLKLADVAKPLVDGLRTSLPAITQLLEGTLGAIGPGVAQALADLTPKLVAVFGVLLEAAAPIVQTFVDVFVQLADVALPAFQPLLPVIGQLAGAFGTLVTAALPLIPVLAQLLSDVGEELAQAMIAAAPAVATIAVVLAEVLTQLRPHIPLLVRGMLLWTGFGKAVGVLSGPLGRTAGFLGSVGDVMKGVGNNAGFLAKTVGTIIPLIGKGLAGALSLVAAHPIVAAVIALVAAVTLAWRHSETFRDVVLSVRDAVVSFGRDALDWIGDKFDQLSGWVSDTAATISDVWGTVTDATTRFADRVGSIITRAGEAIRTGFDTVAQAVVAVWDRTGQPVVDAIAAGFRVIGNVAQFFRQMTELAFRVVGAVIVAAWTTVAPVLASIRDWIADKLTTAFQWLRDVVSAVVGAVVKAWDWLTGVIRTAAQFYWGVIRTVIGAAVQWLRGVWDTAWDAIAGVLSWVMDRVVSPIGRQFGQWFDAIGRGVRTLRDILGRVWGTITDNLSRGWNWVRDHVFTPMKNFVTETIPKAFRTARDAVGRGWDGLKRVIRAPIAWVADNVWNKFAGTINDLASKVGMSRFVPRLEVPQFHQGGEVGDSGGTMRDLVRAPLKRDELMAVLRRGELVLTPEQTRRLTARRDRPHEGMFHRRGEIGGPFSFAGDVLRRVGEFAGDRARDVLGFAFEVLDPLIDLAKRGVNRLGDMYGTRGRLVGGTVNRGIDAAVNWAKGVVNREREKAEQSPQLGSGVGWGAMWRIIRQQFPWARLHSSVRPGARTVSGRQSYHALGRAIDITPSLAIFNWIRDKFKTKTRELIFSPAGGRQIKNGRDMFYTGAVRNMHWNHIHWAMERGGVFTRPTAGMFQFAETARARPEIVAPQPIMAQTFASVLDRWAASAGARGIEMTNYFSERVDPMTVAAELAWRAGW